MTSTLPNPSVSGHLDKEPELRSAEKGWRNGVTTAELTWFCHESKIIKNPEPRIKQFRTFAISPVWATCWFDVIFRCYQTLGPFRPFVAVLMAQSQAQKKPWHQ